MRCGDAIVTFDDRWQGRRTWNLAREVGDFVLKRADGPWAYQLTVVVDDAEQGITDIVRGDDLIDSTPRQILLQRQLGLSTPRYLHVPVLTNQNGEKLSKQTGAAGWTGLVPCCNWWKRRVISVCPLFGPGRSGNSGSR